MARYGMAIDTKRCVGCNACTLACKQANNVPDGVMWSRVLTDGGDMPDTPASDGGNLSMRYFPMGCQHCENPACVKVCPVGATYKDPETGVVRQDYDKCIGCRMCMSACPYSGVRSFNWDEPQYCLGHDVGDADAPAHQKHVVEKCTFCYQRISKGEVPSCMDLCPARARFWGDLDDPNSEVAKKVASRQYTHLLEEKGTKPSVYYLV
ncbi:4Fe-4S dicluster domain-containing protein [Parvibacter caecicola]|uniref:4Fe-4S dicluster domain-containing protein n=2 Tax=Parvibacter caecicola TaxID=747645 RepID=A0A3N0ABC5_9ACTN|nr:4Fe-4S dicluster domain-containing protein [Parvibacter caecicola]MBB3171104.1 molybdopterin-containing oxidoreductase family iron-sulfur binding subunit [Parvibacter caecicola]MCR2042102.1 4Fe-4S dicluster domain-containing protein [Parvibacter caecicola]RNL11482.1 4Fe-4S ferredoxin [Parvibacter caecicola]TJW11252.1 4Fe-4S dicluster domain-containing protein [Parvibacter caecicola]